MHVVSNTSPIWNLASIERLDLLCEQFVNILVPSWDYIPLAFWVSCCAQNMTG